VNSLLASASLPSSAAKSRLDGSNKLPLALLYLTE
jgi:hypothetical protein